jgi:hypothetical protein
MKDEFAMRRHRMVQTLMLAVVAWASQGCSLWISLDDVVPGDASVEPVRDATSLDDSSTGSDSSTSADASTSSDASTSADASTSSDALTSDAGSSSAPSDAAQLLTDVGHAPASDGGDAAGQCMGTEFPVWCPAHGTIGDGGVAAGCWTPSVDCATVKHCSDGDHACGTGYGYNCDKKQCILTCDDAQFPIWCPGKGSVSDGGTFQGCWSADTVCSTVTNCAGTLKACNSAQYAFDCAANKCVATSADAGKEAAPPPACEAGLAACSGQCANLQTDSANCGACGHSCATGTQCFAGQCCAPPAAGGSCNLPACGCATGEVCYVDGTSAQLVCGVTKGLAAGASCTQGSSECAAGLGCVGGVCKAYCSSAADCAPVAGARECRPAKFSDADLPGVSFCARVCDPVNPQTPRSPLLSCPSGVGCVPATTGVSDCAGIGLGVLDGACEDVFDCAPGLICLGTVCTKWCSADSECPATKYCNPFPTKTYAGTVEMGLCLPR